MIMLPQTWSDPRVLFAPNLPPHCEPTTAFLTTFSSVTHTCVPTPFAFISTFLGTLSIVAWLFAQLPQLYKNYKIKSTSGLSVYFLLEWCLGDISNITGALLTKQAAWQVLIGGYYCFVDFSLVAQWIWYEGLKHGRPIKKFWKRRDIGDENSTGGGDMAQVVEGVDPTGGFSGTINPKSDNKTAPRPSTGPRDISFTTPNYGSFQSNKENTPSSRTIHRVQTNSMPSPSPKTILFITLLITLASASPLPQDTITSTTIFTTTHPETTTTSYRIGTVLSWTSTFLYLASRLPQLMKNHSRRSTAGLSLTLFVAAFFGNLFYSSSMLFNPRAWHSYGPHGCHGWVGAEGSDRVEWIAGALPFWLGAAGVLFLDAGVAMQFWWFGQEDKDKGQVLVVVAVPVAEEEEGAEVDGEATGLMTGSKKRKQSRWEEVNGWMRGWKPSLSGMSTPRPESPRVG